MKKMILLLTLMMSFVLFLHNVEGSKVNHQYDGYYISLTTDVGIKIKNGRQLLFINDSLQKVNFRIAGRGNWKAPNGMQFKTIIFQINDAKRIFLDVGKDSDFARALDKMISTQRSMGIEWE